MYWRTDGGETAGVIASDPAWSRAYSTMVRINGGRGGLEIWNARLPLEDTVSALRAKFSQAGCAFWATGGGELMCAIGCDGEKVYRFLVSAGEGPRQSHVFQLTQTVDDFKASLEPPSEHLLKAAPAYPGSTAKSFLGSDATRTRVAVSVADASIDDVRNFYATQMTAAGWQPVFQPGKGLDIYLKDSEVVLVSTETAGDSGGSRIMLLHKPLASGERE